MAVYGAFWRFSCTTILGGVWGFEILTRTNQPAIIKFYGSDARFYSIYMEHLPYPDLAASTWANKAGDFYFTGTSDDAIRVFGTMASAIEYLHGKKIIHNDIKPANIVYDPSRGPVLIDFGLATAFGDPRLRGGTPWYIPAELLTGDCRGPESDVFALGVIMLYMLKKVPLPESTGPQWQIGSIRDDPAPIRRWLDGVAVLQRGLEPNGLEGLVKDTLIARPDERISAKEIVNKQQQTE
ncbi:Carbon catabolite-derepressing protein kinase [Metarhizium brunneum]|uniref:Carbon catabolite-derepressing protein kinase n=1 Tax=Metarhizium brunneum TaxID=500148 RepID=A0A7D5V317_9HYPO|nr:Carbon catabolite-derepressing protein kinase [Metarhizium brunneum]